MSGIALLALLRRLWPYVAALCAALALIGGIHHHGYVSGVAHVEARDAKIAARIEVARVKLVAALDRTAAALGDARQRQDTTFTRIRTDAAPIILRPIYRSVCVDSDGIGLLDRARAAANGELAGEPAAGAAGAAGLPAQY